MCTQSCLSKSLSNAVHILSRSSSFFFYYSPRVRLSTYSQRLPFTSFKNMLGSGRGVRDAVSLDRQPARNDGRRVIRPMSGTRAERVSVGHHATLHYRHIATLPALYVKKTPDSTFLGPPVFFVWPRYHSGTCSVDTVLQWNVLRRWTGVVILVYYGVVYAVWGGVDRHRNEVLDNFLYILSHWRYDVAYLWDHCVLINGNEIQSLSIV